MVLAGTNPIQKSIGSDDGLSSTSVHFGEQDSYLGGYVRGYLLGVPAHGPQEGPQLTPLMLRRRGSQILAPALAHSDFSQLTDVATLRQGESLRILNYFHPTLNQPDPVPNRSNETFP